LAVEQPEQFVLVVVALTLFVRLVAVTSDAPKLIVRIQGVPEVLDGFEVAADGPGWK
jgi:hypothetical protein